MRRRIETLEDRISRLSAAVLRISASLDLETVLREIVDRARERTGACGEHCIVFDRITCAGLVCSCSWLSIRKTSGAGCDQVFYELLRLLDGPDRHRVGRFLSWPQVSLSRHTDITAIRISCNSQLFRAGRVTTRARGEHGGGGATVPRGTAFMSPDVVTAADSSALSGLLYTGHASGWSFDYRVSTGSPSGPYLFSARITGRGVE